MTSCAGDLFCLRRVVGHQSCMRWLEQARPVQTRAEAAEKEVAHVKEKAWKMMEEKDAQVKAAKVSAPPPPLLLDMTPLPVAPGHFTSRV